MKGDTSLRESVVRSPVNLHSAENLAVSGCAGQTENRCTSCFREVQSMYIIAPQRRMDGLRQSQNTNWDRTVILFAGLILWAIFGRLTGLVSVFDDRLF